ncbi:proteasome subunit alpha type-2-a [Quercus suber]|uniref:Proteasome subunit alpha type-2-a n=1 Tax=Quercus suber TaxID=58331 RepID=A0AAW0JRS9_QUESU
MRDPGQVDPSGSYFSWKASAMGKNVSNAKTFLEKRYTDDMELDDARPPFNINLEGRVGVVALSSTSILKPLSQYTCEGWDGGFLKE